MSSKNNNFYFKLFALFGVNGKINQLVNFNYLFLKSNNLLNSAFEISVDFSKLPYKLKLGWEFVKASRITALQSSIVALAFIFLNFL